MKYYPCLLACLQHAHWGGTCCTCTVSASASALCWDLTLVVAVVSQYGIFLFFAGWVLLMTLFVAFLLPETKNIPIEEMVVVWRKHWLWSRFVEPAAADLKTMEAGNNGAQQLPSSYAGPAPKCA